MVVRAFLLNLGLLVISQFVAIGQTLSDYQLILQQILDVPELERRIKKAQTLERNCQVVLLVLDNKIIPNNVELIKFGRKLRFEKPEELIFHKEFGWLEFEKFEFTDNVAAVSLFYLRVTEEEYEEFQLELLFENDSGSWKLIKKTHH